MIIKSVFLTDVKSYDDSSPLIQFQSGVNAIIGENGSGKSTLCEAIGFTLFDFLHPYSQADFVREGKRSGRINVRFQSDHADKVYRVERGVGQSKFDVFDETDKKKIPLKSKDEVVSWLKDELGIPASMDLQTLWKSSLGVPQGKFTNDFAETPRIRAQLFNPLLEVEIYRRLWQDMKAVVSVLREKKQVISHNITRLDSIVEELPTLAHQSKTLTNQIKKAQNLISELNVQIKEYEKKKKQLKTIQQSIQQLTNDLKILQEKETDYNQRLEETKHHLEEAKNAQELLEKHEKNYDRYISLDKKREQLFSKKNEKEALEKKKVAIDKKQSLFEQKIAHLQENVAIAKESKEQLEMLKPLVKKQEELEEKLRSITQQEKELYQTKEEIKVVKKRISELRLHFQTLQKEITAISEKKGPAKKQKELRKEKEALIQNQSVISHQLEEHNKSISLLKKEQQSMCPTCSRPLKEQKRIELIAQKETELITLSKKRNDIEKRLSQVQKQLADAEDAYQEVKRLPDLEKMKQSMQKEADEQKQKKKSLEQCKDTLIESIENKSDLKKELERLQNPKESFQLAQLRYKDHKDNEKDLKSKKQELSIIKKERKDLDERLQDFRLVETEIEAIEKEQKSLKNSYEQYLQSKDLASKKAFWMGAIEELKRQQKVINQKIESVSKKLIKEKKEFDKEELDSISTSLIEKIQQRVRQQTQMDEWLKQKEELDNRINHLKKQKAERDALRKKRDSLEKDIEFTLFLRETYQKTRPLITEILVEEISREADRIYRELRGVASEELAWKKNYEIVVYDQGNERAFHKLSGGEQMCAALSVRLAILKLLSTLDIVFLDEPTMNLDDEKKENLVAQLRELSGFSQIFVISHDETFESLTEHVITLEKKQGATRLLTHFQGGF